MKFDIENQLKSDDYKIKLEDLSNILNFVQNFSIFFSFFDKY